MTQQRQVLTNFIVILKILSMESKELHMEPKQAKRPIL